MNEPVDILSEFCDFAVQTLKAKFPSADIGLSRTEIETVAWCNISSKNAVSGIKLWQNGHYYVEVFPLDTGEPTVAEFSDLFSTNDFESIFKDFLNAISDADERSPIQP